MGKGICDALIIGAGPAGATAGFLMASRGFKVVLLDRTPFPRPKLCAGLLTWKTMRVLAAVFRTDPQTLQSHRIIRHESRRYLVSDPCGRAFRGVLDDPFYLVDRQAYDHFWLERAIEAGAEFHPDSAVVTIDPERHEVVTGRGEKWTGRFIFGADGVHSRVRHALIQSGRIPKPSHCGIASALECFPPEETVRQAVGCPAIYYGYVRRGYAWSFPGLRDRILGIAALRTRRGRRLKASFHEFLSSLKVENVGTLKIQGHSLPYGNHLKKPGHGRLLLVGDAAGLADPFLGEGIYYAHRSAQLAARAAVETYRNPDAGLSCYRHLFRHSIYPELRYAWAGRQIIFSLPRALYYPALATFLRLMSKIGEETIQGKRSFRWFRKMTYE